MGSAKKKRSHAPTVRDKNILNLYNKLHEIVSLLAELLHIQLMTDTTVLHLSTLGKLLINKLHEIVYLLAELLHIQLMTDTTVLHLSTLGKLHSLILLN